MLFSWRRFRERVRTVLHFDEEPSRLAAGMAVGVFIGVTPFYGLHTLLALVAASLLRLNKAATITGAWINLPWFAPFVYAFCLRLGEALLSGDFGGFSWASVTAVAESASEYLRAPRAHAGSFVQALWDMLFVASKPLFVGTTIVGLLGGLVTYLITLEAIREVRRLRHRAQRGQHDSDARRPAGARRR